jgi:hypothetical protein
MFEESRETLKAQVFRKPNLGHPSKPREEDPKTQVLKTKPGAPLKTEEEERRPRSPSNRGRRAKTQV